MSKDSNKNYCASCGKSITYPYGLVAPDGMMYHRKCQPDPKEEVSEDKPAPSKVVRIKPKTKRFPALAICLICQHRWPGQTAKYTSIFKIKCPSCGGTESFISFLPDDFLVEYIT